MQKRRVRRRRQGCGCVATLLLLILAAVAAFWAASRAVDLWGSLEQRTQLREALAKTFQEEPPSVQALLVTQLGEEAPLFAQGEQTPLPPASLAKLFAVDYAAEMADLEEVVSVNAQALALTKPGSSVAGILPQDYFLHNLLAAMLVPSGNDAAYAVADYCGSLLSPQAGAGQERVESFLDHLGVYLQEEGYGETVLHDPSGFDLQAVTTAEDVKMVAERLLSHAWFREMVAQSSYTATLPDGSLQVWQNTNLLLDPTSEYYHGNVTGVKTGSLENCYNLVVLYEQGEQSFLVCILGATSNDARYQTAQQALAALEQILAPAA